MISDSFVEDPRPTLQSDLQAVSLTGSYVWNSVGTHRPPGLHKMSREPKFSVFAPFWESITPKPPTQVHKNNHEKIEKCGKKGRQKKNKRKNLDGLARGGPGGRGVQGREVQVKKTWPEQQNWPKKHLAWPKKHLAWPEKALGLSGHWPKNFRLSNQNFDQIRKNKF